MYHVNVENNLQIPKEKKKRGNKYILPFLPRCFDSLGVMRLLSSKDKG
jgi:hypothetical protein